MTATNGWPGKPGVPLNPERDGAHRLGRYFVIWRADTQDYVNHNGNVLPPEVAYAWPYLGPCLTPDEATALQARADQAALGHAREADRADQSEFLHKQEIAALQKRVAKLEALVKSAFTEGFNAGHEEGEELGEFTANGGDARRHESRGPIWHWQSSETKATLEGKKDE